MNEVESNSSHDSPKPLIVRYPLAEMQRLARTKLSKINFRVLLFIILICLFLGNGYFQSTIFFLAKHLRSFAAGIVLWSLFQAASAIWIGKSDFWYSFLEDKIVYCRPPESEEISMEEISEIQYVPLKEGECLHLEGPNSENYFCLAISLRNGREIRLIGYLNLRKAWDFLAGRLPEKVTDFHSVPKSAYIPLTRLLMWGLIGVLWALGTYRFFPEDLVVPVFLFGIALCGVPVLVRFYRYGRPPSEKISVRKSLAV